MQSFLIRLFDVGLALIALVLLTVPMLLISLAIRLYDGGPVLFRQQRVGKDLRPFDLLKFRTMIVQQDGSNTGRLADASDKVAARAAFRTTTTNDPRITPVGRFLRPSHLDELPQLLNVLRGHMSLVGVRPDTEIQEVDYTLEHWRARHAYRPGITGPAQLDASIAGLEDRARVERDWLERRGIGMYAAMLWRTFAKVAKSNSN